MAGTSIPIIHRKKIVNHKLKRLELLCIEREAVQEPSTKAPPFLLSLWKNSPFIGPAMTEVENGVFVSAVVDWFQEHK